jgi:hypothetical protein
MRSKARKLGHILSFRLDLVHRESVYNVIYYQLHSVFYHLIHLIWANKNKIKKTINNTTPSRRMSSPS